VSIIDVPISNACDRWESARFLASLDIFNRTVDRGLSKDAAVQHPGLEKGKHLFLNYLATN
jgi:hypothetical protein